MRLLHTSTYALKGFPRAVPPYAILSHTWDVEEVSFHDIQEVSSASRRKGFTKVSGCCHQARLAGYDWVWIDTCCIDKSSSAEVSEAINSMYGWYQRSAVCFAYLSDVPRFRFTDSRWFERGWTLQELIAPRHVEFYTADWLEIGTKSSLEIIISSTTGISVEVLRGASPRNYTAAQRMSWASGRRTTRPEDEAYCLMGLFDVNMPVLYGEARPFERLQQEILRQSEDFSLPAWSPAANERAHSPCTGVLAPNPTVFKRPDLTTHLPSTVFGFDDAEFVLFVDVGTLGWKDIQPHRWDSVSSFPMPGKHEPTMGAPVPRKHGSLWGFDAHQFDVALPDGTTMSASAALLLYLPSADTETENRFVALFGYSPSAHPHYHLEPLDKIDVDGKDFWPHFLRRRTPRGAGGSPSDRSTLGLPCGVGVAATAKQRPGGVPTLTLRTFRDGAGFLEMMGRTLSTSWVLWGYSSPSLILPWWAGTGSVSGSEAVGPPS